MSTASMTAAALPPSIAAQIESEIQTYKLDLFDQMAHGGLDAKHVKLLVDTHRAILTKKELDKYGVKAGKAKVPTPVVSANATANYNIAAQDTTQPIANSITPVNHADQNLGIPANGLGIQYSTDWHKEPSVNESYDFSFNDYNPSQLPFNQDVGGWSDPVNEVAPQQVNVKTTPAKVTQVANPSAPVITGVSCRKANHTHTWPTEGQLVIERCEHRCLICISQNAPKADHEWSSAWYLRRHIRDVHGKDFPLLVVAEGWKARPNGNTRPEIKAPRVPGSNKKKAGTKKDKARAEAARKRGEAFLSSPPHHESSHSFGIAQPVTQPEQAFAQDFDDPLSACNNSHADANAASINTSRVATQPDLAFALDLHARLSAYNKTHADVNAASSGNEQMVTKPVQASDADLHNRLSAYNNSHPDANNAFHGTEQVATQSTYTSDEDLHARLSAYLANSKANHASAAVSDMELQPYYNEDADMAEYTQDAVDYSSNVDTQLNSFTSVPTDTTSSHDESTISSFDNGFEFSQHNDQSASSFTSYSAYEEPIKNNIPTTQAELDALFASTTSEAQAVQDHDMSDADTLFIQDTTADQAVDYCHLNDVDTSAAIAAPFEVSDASEQNYLTLPATINDQAAQNFDNTTVVTPAFEATNAKELSTLLNFGGVDIADQQVTEQLTKSNNSHQTYADANQFGIIEVMPTSKSPAMSPAQIQEESFAKDAYYSDGQNLFSEKDFDLAYPKSPSPDAATITSSANNAAVDFNQGFGRLASPDPAAYTKMSAAIEKAVIDAAEMDPRKAFDYSADENNYDDSTNFSGYLQTQLDDIYSEFGMNNMFDFVAYNNS